MKRSIIQAIAAFSILLAGCSGKEQFTISGHIEGAKSDTLTIEEMTANAMEIRGSVLIDQNGDFSYSDTASNPRLLFMKTRDGEYMTFMVVNGDHAVVSAESGKFRTTFKVSGSKQSELVYTLNQELLHASNVLDSLNNQYQQLKGKGNDPQVDTWIQTEFTKLMTQQRDFIRAFIENNPAEPASLLALSHQVARQPALNAREDFGLFEKVDANLMKKYPNSPLTINLHKYIVAMKPQIEATVKLEQNTGIGKEAKDFTLPTPEGKDLSLSSLRGQYVLLDFWASWCSPCRRENPTLVQAYKKYHDKGFEILQVSLDKTRDEWLDAISKDGLTWKHVSDLKYWGSAAAKLYGIESIPANLLLDKDGKIIAQNLRGPALEAKLAEIFQ
jgi:peroxiredoxin